MSLTRAALSIDETTPIEFIMKETAVPAKRKGKRKGAVAARRKLANGPETPGRSKPVPEDQRSKVGSDSGIEEALRAWRLAEARRRGVPAFRILSDQALRAMATRRPGTVRELLAIPGIGITTVEKYRASYIASCKRAAVEVFRPTTAPLKQMLRKSQEDHTPDQAPGGMSAPDAGAVRANPLHAPQHFLCFLPLPHGQGSFLPILGSGRLIRGDAALVPGPDRSG